MRNGTTGTIFNGLISNVQLFDTALPAAGTDSIETLYNNGTPLTTAIQSANLKAWWKLDGTELFGNTNWSIENQVYPSNYNTALDFDGNNDYIQLNSPMSTSSTDWSISCWFKCSQGGGNRIFVGNSGDKFFGINWGKLKFYSADNSFDMSTSVPMNDGNWHHVIYTYNYTSGAFKSYIDGIIDDNQIATAGVNIPPFKFFGSRTSGQYFADCELNGIAYFGTELSQSDVTSIYNSGTPSDLSSLNPLGWWKLDNTSTGIQDSVGSNNGTNNGASEIDTYVSTQSGTSSGMTEQSLVNNNVSVLNGESSGMTSGNLVLSDLTRNLPYENYSLSFDSGTGATWSGWFNRSSSGGFYIMGTYGIGQIQFFVFQGNNYVTAYAGNSAGAQRTMAKANVTAFTTNQWYHLTFVYNESESNDADKMKIYIDGVLQANAVAGSSLTSLNSSTASFDIGRLTGTASTQFVGKISNVAIWNTNLSSTEVQNLYANGIPQDLTTFTPQPINWWTLGKESFWDGSDWVIRDMIGTNDGLSSNMGGSELTGDAPRSQANGLGTNIAVPTNLKGEAGWSDKNGYSINMSSTARTTDTP